MKNLIENFAELLKVKTIVTFVVLFVFVNGALSGTISPSEVTTTVSMVFTFYFCTQSDRKKRTGTDESAPQPTERDKKDDNE